MVLPGLQIDGVSLHLIDASGPLTVSLLGDVTCTAAGCTPASGAASFAPVTKITGGPLTGQFTDTTGLLTGVTLDFSLEQSPTAAPEPGRCSCSGRVYPGSVVSPGDGAAGPPRKHPAHRQHSHPFDIAVSPDGTCWGVRWMFGSRRARIVRVQGRHGPKEVR